MITLDACFYGLNDVQLWLMQELYGPGGFGPRTRPLAGILQEGANRISREYALDTAENGAVQARGSLKFSRRT